MRRAAPKIAAILILLATWTSGVDSFPRRLDQQASPQPDIRLADEQFGVSSGSSGSVFISNNGRNPATEFSPSGSPFTGGRYTTPNERPSPGQRRIPKKAKRPLARPRREPIKVPSSARGRIRQPSFPQGGWLRSVRGDGGRGWQLTKALEPSSPQGSNLLEAPSERCLPGQYVAPSADSAVLTPQATCPRVFDLPHSWRDTVAHPWLVDYWKQNRPEFRTNPGGFVSVFRGEFTGDPTSDCSLSSTCDFDVCGRALASVPVCNQKPAAHILLAMRKLQEFFTGVIRALDTAALYSALTKDSFALTFSLDGTQADLTLFKTYATIFNVVIGLFGPLSPAIRLAWPALGFEPAVFFLPPHLIANTQVLGMSTIQTPVLDTPRVSAVLGVYVKNAYSAMRDRYIAGHDDLMRGGKFMNLDFVEWVSNGALTQFPGINVAAATQLMTVQLDSRMINALWRIMRVVIIGGYKCGSTQPIGKAPTEGTMCVGDEEYSIFWWRKDTKDNHFDSNRKFGWVAMPLGWSLLGKGEYSHIKREDVMHSSVAAYKAAGNRYTPEKLVTQVMQAVKEGGPELAQQGGRFPGTWTIPVCDIRNVVENHVPVAYKNQILTGYGEESRPVWCSRVLCGNEQETEDFFRAANMYGYESPVRKCPDDQRLWRRERLSLEHIVRDPADFVRHPPTHVRQTIKATGRAIKNIVKNGVLLRWDRLPGSVMNLVGGIVGGGASMAGDLITNPQKRR
ncbi:MAG: hypothetical protein M1826_006757 [Phylliscum demangeonii]|nr:MAG: hypothetical protein M1826_006757 [Phylliscum demangeonii]